ncbi:MAG: hypothetical protein ACMXYD_04980 [Candidatus Woesearchaeota archaeon]
MSKQTMPSLRFPIVMAAVFAVLLVLLGVQTVQLFDQEVVPVESELSVEADVVVYIGEMYFRQEGMPDNQIEVSVGDTIVFVNEGALPHTATIPALGVDEFLEPGDEVVVEVTSELRDELLNCRLHAQHEAIIRTT